MVAKRMVDPKYLVQFHQLSSKNKKEKATGIYSILSYNKVLSERATTPGNAFPSNNSKDAPPPVET
jgi:hypothetical protein